MKKCDEQGVSVCFKKDEGLIDVESNYRDLQTIPLDLRD